MLQRLRKSSQFRATFDQGCKVVGKYFVLVATERREESELRLGLVISRKVGNAVTRNYVRRRVREYFRLHAPCQTALDLVVVARHSASHADTAEMWQELSRSMTRLIDKELKKCA